MSNITTDHVDYKAIRKNLPESEKHNGLHHYATYIEKHFIPNVKTDRPWNTLGLLTCGAEDGMIVFIHSNLTPDERYAWLKKYKDIVCVCGTKATAEKMKSIANTIYLPLSVDTEELAKYRCKKLYDSCYAGNLWGFKKEFIDKYVPSDVPKYGKMPRNELLRAIAPYKNVYAVGITAIEARALGCNILKCDDRFDPEDFPLFDVKDAIKLLEEQLAELDRSRRPKQ